MNPRDLGVPHDTWRPHQYETYKSIYDSTYKHLFVESPTGSGKSTHPTALSHNSDVMVLVATLGLIAQYEKEYGFTAIRGRQFYQCADLDKLEEWSNLGYDPPTAFDCHLSKMSDCEFADFCPYLSARNSAMGAPRVAMTYKYAAVAQWPKLRRGILVCDEGHSAAEEILSCTEFTINQYHVQRFHCPSPKTVFTWRVQEMVNGKLKTHILDYLARVYRYTSRFSANADKGPLPASGHRLHLRVGRMMEDIETHDSWFLDASPTSFQLRPLDARPVAHLISDRKEKCVYMSATIGDPGPLANEMGIEAYDYLSTPHLIPADLRPVHSIFKPRMTKANRDRRPGLYRAQATAIAHFIKSNIPPSWRGLILTTSYFKIGKLTEFLSQDSVIGDRIWAAPKSAQGVSKRIAAFLKDPREGVIAIDTIQGWGHGLDLRGDLGRFVIVAGVPHPNPSDPFERARMKRKGGRRYARWTAYNAVVQACGRVTRGDRGEDGEYTLNVAALADGSCTAPAALRYFPLWFREAMV